MARYLVSLPSFWPVAQFCCPPPTKRKSRGVSAPALASDGSSFFELRKNCASSALDYAPFLVGGTPSRAKTGKPVPRQGYEPVFFRGRLLD